MASGIGVEFNNLPETVILQIFQALSVKDLCAARRVCRTWRRIIADNALWRHVDLRAYKLNLRRMWKIIRTHFSPVLLTLRLQGYLHPAGCNWNKSSLSDAMLKELQERCPNLTLLELQHTNLNEVSSKYLPSSLTTLILRHSLMPPRWLTGMSEPGFLPHIISIDFTHSSKTSNQDLLDLSQRTKMKELRLNGCYRLTAEGICNAVESLSCLEVLEIEQTNVNDLVFHKMCRNLKSLRQLDLTLCQGLTAGCLHSLATMTSLECLNLTQVKGINPEDVIVLRKLTSLKYLKLPSEAFKDVSEQIQGQLTKCDIQFGVLANKIIP